ncbi:hypothetical protein RB596_009316 [Gaeumannomyces avenae]
MAAPIQPQPALDLDRAGDTSLLDHKDQPPGCAYCYSPLSQPDNIRLLRLMPHADRHAPIRCQLLEYPLQETAQATHLYEALSYVWGSVDRGLPIYIWAADDDKNGAPRASRSTNSDQYLLVTTNLHAALTHLRDSFLERIIWIDAVCINQQDDVEKGRQVQSMARIYASASRVVVWLGEAADGSDRALAGLRQAAGEQEAAYRRELALETLRRVSREEAKLPIKRFEQYNGFITQMTKDLLEAGSAADVAVTLDEPTQQAIFALLERPWFGRIWVLQEVAAARYVLVKCGGSTVDGSTFSLGLDAAQLSYEGRPALQRLIPPLIRLIQGAASRPQCATSMPQTSLSHPFSLNICTIGELVDRFRTRKATNPLDRVYALLGMSREGPGMLTVDYTESWEKLVLKLVRLALSDRMAVETWGGRALGVIRGKGRMLGLVSSAEFRGDSQRIRISWKNEFPFRSLSSGPYTLQPSTNPVQRKDRLVLLQGASESTIVRVREGYSEVIRIAVPLGNGNDHYAARLRSNTVFPMSLLLVWDLDRPEISAEDPDYEPMMKDQEPGEKDIFGVAAKMWNFGNLLNEVGDCEKAKPMIQAALEAYRTLGQGMRDQLGRKDPAELDQKLWPPPSPNSTVGSWHQLKNSRDQMPLLLAAMNGDAAAAALLLDEGAGIESTNGRDLRTPLSWAAGHGSGALVRLLLDRGADIEAGDIGGWTPLHWAIVYGHQAVVELLLDRGANVEARGFMNWTPLHLAAENGYEPLVRLLGARGGVEAEAEFGSRPLHLAAINGHETVVKLLVEELGAEKTAKDEEGLTPMELAIKNGHEAVVRLLLPEASTGADAGAALPRRYGTHTPLLSDGPETPLHLAARCGQETVVRLLAGEQGADKEAKGPSNRTPLHLAAMNGHVAVVRALIGLGANKHAVGNLGESVLHTAAAHGHEAVVRLLVAECGFDVDLVDSWGKVALHAAAGGGHEAVARTLLALGANRHAATEEGDTALHEAAAAGHEKMVRLLAVEFGLDVEAVGSLGRRPLHRAASSASKTEAVIRLLVELGADKSARDVSCRTPRDEALIVPREHIISLLSPDTDGQDTERHACHRCQRETDKELEALKDQVIKNGEGWEKLWLYKKT